MHASLKLVVRRSRGLAAVLAGATLALALGCAELRSTNLGGILGGGTVLAEPTIIAGLRDALRLGAERTVEKTSRVNVVSPGPIYFEGGSWEMIEKAMPSMFKAALAQCAIGRMGTPEEVARAVVFLASPAASLITGANLVTDGGFTRRTAY